MWKRHFSTHKDFEVNVLRGNDNKDIDANKKSLPKLKSKVIPIITAVCVTAVLTAAAAAFFVNCFKDEKDDTVHFDYSSQVTAYTAVSSTEETLGSSPETEFSTTTKKSLSTTLTSQTTVQTETQAQTQKVYSFPADINLVTAQQLMAIDGVGEITAGKILDYRNGVGVIRNMDQLLEIDGIGEITLEKLKKYLYVSPSDYAELTTRAEQTQTEKITTKSLASSTAATTTTKKTTTQKTTNTKSTTTAATTTTTTTGTVTTAEPHMKTVNINTADAQELAECLLIDIELAEDIVELRNNIWYFSNRLELLYVDGFTEEMLVERRPYITL